MNRNAILVGILVGAAAVALWHRRRAQSSDRRSWNPSDMVTEASDESFPASDPPARTVTSGSSIGEGLA